MPASVSISESRETSPSLTRLGPNATTLAPNASIDEDVVVFDIEDGVALVEETGSTQGAQATTEEQDSSQRPLASVLPSTEDASDNAIALDTAEDATALQTPAMAAVTQQVNTANASIEGRMQRRKIDNAGQSEAFVHHVNWIGEPVFSRTATTPAVSLCAILASAKKQNCDLEINLCTTVLLQNAFHVVDSILFNCDLDLLNRFSGSSLQNAVIGLCYMFYSEYGDWRRDKYYAPKDDIPVEDTMWVPGYGGNSVELNGWYSDKGIPT